MTTDQEPVNGAVCLGRYDGGEAASWWVIPADDPFEPSDMREFIVPDSIIAEAQRPFREALTFLVQQIEMTNPRDDHDHDLKMNVAYIEARALVAEESTNA